MTWAIVDAHFLTKGPTVEETQQYREGEKGKMIKE